jgi:RNA polymerase sigma-70 factor (ECF subfamily)
MDYSYLDDLNIENEYATQDITDEIFGVNNIMKIVQMMPPGYRVVFNLFAIEGYSHKEIAKELNISESTSKSQFLRARKWLMQRLEK